MFGCWRLANRIVSSIHQRDEKVEVERWTKASDLLRVDSYQQVPELKELITLLSIGDRVRVLCDDGILVAEKISRTQFKLIECQMMSDWIH